MLAERVELYILYYDHLRAGILKYRRFHYIIGIFAVTLSCIIQSLGRPHRRLFKAMSRRVVAEKPYYAFIMLRYPRYYLILIHHLKKISRPPLLYDRARPLSLCYNGEKPP